MKSVKIAAAVLVFGTIAAPLSASAQIFDGNNLLGTAIGAGIGGALGSNIAGGGVQDEGTAIGAVVGGLLGYGIANRSRSGNYGPYYGSGYQGASRYGSYGYGGYGGYGGYSGYSGYNTHYYSPPVMPAPQYVYGGSVVSQVYTVPTYHTYTYTPAPVVHQVQRRVVYTAPPVYTNCGC